MGVRRPRPRALDVLAVYHEVEGPRKPPVRGSMAGLVSCSQLFGGRDLSQCGEAEVRGVAELREAQQSDMRAINVVPSNGWQGTFAGPTA